MAQPSSLRKIPGNFLATEVDGELILVHADSGAFFSLKGTGLAIWNALDRSERIDDVVEILLGRYAIGRSECHASITAFSHQLVEAGFAKYC